MPNRSPVDEILLQAKRNRNRAFYRRLGWTFLGTSPFIALVLSYVLFGLNPVADFFRHWDPLPTWVRVVSVILLVTGTATTLMGLRRDDSHYLHVGPWHLIIAVMVPLVASMILDWPVADAPAATRPISHTARTSAARVPRSAPPEPKAPSAPDPRPPFPEPSPAQPHILLADGSEPDGVVALVVPFRSAGVIVRTQTRLDFQDGLINYCERGAPACTTLHYGSHIHKSSSYIARIEDGSEFFIRDGVVIDPDKVGRGQLYIRY